jgi:hypothetical protein
MGDGSALNSLNRVLEAHHLELEKELRIIYPSKKIKHFVIGIVNSCYRIDASAILTDGSELPLYVDGFDIDSLGERFPDCDVGY